MSSIPGGSDRQAQLARRMAELGVTEEDLEESFARSAGPGGQNVNKTETCVILVHRPSGLQVRCQDSRQQAFNRFRARQLLLDKIVEARREREAAERSRIEKLRRQKRGRSRGAKQRMLADKGRQAAKKRLRRVGGDD
jgi:protein subunit release factor B